jgi:hypothetical protein
VALHHERHNPPCSPTTSLPHCQCEFFLEPSCRFHLPLICHLSHSLYISQVRTSHGGPTSRKQSKSLPVHPSTPRSSTDQPAAPTNTLHHDTYHACPVSIHESVRVSIFTLPGPVHMLTSAPPLFRYHMHVTKHNEQR